MSTIAYPGDTRRAQFELICPLLEQARGAICVAHGLQVAGVAARFSQKAHLGQVHNILCDGGYTGDPFAQGMKAILMDDFFSIKRTKHGKCSPSRTYQARRDWLYKCDSGNTVQKEDIMSKFGHVYRPSY